LLGMYVTWVSFSFIFFVFFLENARSFATQCDFDVHYYITTSL